MFFLKTKTYKLKTISGFTLIELLVVIAIISLLSSIVLASVNGSRAGARDVRRLADMRSIIYALELYYQDNGHFPCKFFAQSTNPFFLQPLIDGKYLAVKPADPRQGEPSRYYTYSTADLNGVCGQTAILGFVAEMKKKTPCPGGLYRIGNPYDNSCYIQYPTIKVTPCRSNYPYDPRWSDVESNNLPVDPYEICADLLDQGYCDYDTFTSPIPSNCKYI